jgi:hypothetical protein
MPVAALVYRGFLAIVFGEHYANIAPLKCGR